MLIARYNNMCYKFLFFFRKYYVDILLDAEYLNVYNVFLLHLPIIIAYVAPSIIMLNICAMFLALLSSFCAGHRFWVFFYFAFKFFFYYTFL